jgi:hypothetical protein
MPMLSTIRSKEIEKGIHKEDRVDENVKDQPWNANKQSVTPRYTNLVRKDECIEKECP